MTVTSDTAAEAPVLSSGHQPLLQLRGMTKLFPNVRALNDVSLDIHAGEVLAIIGENGAGKSTLLKILSGDYKPDAGQITFDGARVEFDTPAVARRHGVRVIYQEPEIVSTVSVAENIFIGALPRRFGIWMDWSRLYRQTAEQIAEFGFADELSPHDQAENLTPAQRQLVEILRALKTGVRVLALDEPTSSLSDNEANLLFETVHRLKQEGVALIYVSHRLREILKLADRVAILRDGELVAIRPAKETNETELMSLMVGRPLSQLYRRRTHVQAEIVLRAENLTNDTLNDVNFEVHRGEVLGFAGLIGAGRTAVAQALFGAEPLKSGRILLNGNPVKLDSPRSAMKAGIGFAPEERKAEALLMDLSVQTNASIALLREITRLRFVKRGREHKIVKQYTDRLRVKTPSLEQEIRKLSGGNQQKVVLARWLARSPKVLILDEPTRGIDVGAKAEIYQLIDELAAEGLAVIFISSELPEVLGICDRIIVMEEGRITGELDADEATEEKVLGLAMQSKVGAAQQS